MTDKHMAWRDIETAPKDGTEVIIQDMDYDKDGNKSLGYRYVAYYDEEDQCWFDGSGTFIDVSPDYWLPLNAIDALVEALEHAETILGNYREAIEDYEGEDKGMWDTAYDLVLAALKAAKGK